MQSSQETVTVYSENGKCCQVQMNRFIHMQSLLNNHIWIAPRWLIFAFEYCKLAKYPSVGRVSAMVLCCHVQSHKNRPVCWYASWNFAHSSTVFRSLNELIPLTSSVEVAGSSTLPAHKNTYELEHRNCVIKMFFQHQSVTHLP